MTYFMVESVRTQPAEKAVSVISTVAKQLQPFILLLSAVFPYGIGLNRSDEKQEITYEAPKLSWRRPLSMYSLGLLLWMVFCVSIQTFNILLEIPFPIDLVTLRSPGNTSGEVTLLLGENRILSAVIASCRLFELIGLYLSAPLLAKWLNELTAIEIKLNTHFSPLGTRMNVNVTLLRNSLAAFYVVLPGAFWSVAYFWIFLPQYQFNWKYSALGYFWFVSVIFYLLITEFMEDMKMILMLEILRRIYSQMRNAIRQEVGLEEIKEKDVVVAWDGLVTKLRQHVKLTGECMKTQLILNICETVFVVSVGTYVVIRSLGGYNGSTNIGYAATAGFYCVFLAARLYTKVAIAESIYAQERLFIEDLKDYELRARATSPGALHELRNLEQSLLFAPARIQIGSCCDLDSKLLVQVIIQTIPMLIAVAQFHT